MIVRCVETVFNYITVGKVYYVINVDFGFNKANLVKNIKGVVITDDDGDDLWYPLDDYYNRFEIVKQ